MIKNRFSGLCFVVSLVGLFLGTIIMLLANPAAAQDNQPEGPVYIVQEGDSLWNIAQRFGVSLEDLSTLNNISDPSQVIAGARLLIPGLEGINGVLTTTSVPYGESMRSLSRRYRLPERMLAKLNHLSSPSELYAGYSLILPENSPTVTNTQRALLSPGLSILELSLLSGVNPWQIAGDSQISNTWQTVPGDILLMPGESTGGPAGFPGQLQALEINPLPLLQGKTSVIKVKGDDGLSLGGSLLDHRLNFFPEGDGYVALQGIHAMTESGIYPLVITGTLQDRTPFSYTQSVFVQAVDYPYDQPLTVNPTTIDPAVTRPEDAQWTALAEPVTPDRMWSERFELPSPLDVEYCLESNQCWTSRFGNRRSYNGSPYNAFHTGLDIAGGAGTKIFAPADGVVVFAGPLTVRGKATMIDHGHGIYTGYMHQSEIYVEAGQAVKAGELIGLVGGTGRVEGPHLHWEVWAGGVQVDPIDWLANIYP